MKEKANAMSAVPRPAKKVKGTVLFTVVCVMMVLIVFLMGTLTLAATANKRALTNFQQEQTEYTARAVLEAVITNINSDLTGGLAADIQNMSGTQISVPVTIPDDKAQEVSNVIIRKTTQTRQSYNDTDGWQTVPVYEMEVTVRSQTTAAETTYTAYIGAKGESTSTITTPNTTITSSGGGGAFVSIGDLSSDIGTGGYITGGTFVGLENQRLGTPRAGGYKIGGSQESMMEAPIYIYGDLSSDLKFSVNYRAPGDYFAVIGNLDIDQATGFQTIYEGYSWGGASVDYAKTPILYVEGVLDHHGCAFTVGDADHPTNVFTGSFNFGGVTAWGNGSDVYIYGDLYAMDEDATSYIRGHQNWNSNQLYSWVDSTLSITGAPDKTNGKYGNVFAKGSLQLDASNNDIRIGGAVRAERDVEMKGGHNIITGNDTANSTKGDVVVGGTLTVASGTTLKVNGDLVVGTLVNNGKIECSGTIKAVNHPADGDLNGKTVTEVTAPAASSVTMNVSTYYTNLDGTPLTDLYILREGQKNLPADHYIVQARYQKHTINPDGTETVDTHGDQWNNSEWSGREDIIPEFTFVPDATYATVEDYLTATSDLYVDMMTYTSAANAKTSTNTQSYYDLSVSAAYDAEVYPDKYEKKDIDIPDPNDPSATITVPNMPSALFTIPRDTDYTSKYITDIKKTGLYHTDLTGADRTPAAVAADPYDGKGDGYIAPIYEKSGNSARKYAPIQNDTAHYVNNIDSASPPAGSAVVVKTDSNGKPYYEVSKSCVLSGFLDKNVYINTTATGSAAPITVILDNVTLSISASSGNTIIVNDAAEVSMFVVGEYHGGSIITLDYLNRIYNGEGAITNDQSTKLGTNWSDYKFFSNMTADMTIKNVVTSVTDRDYPDVMIYAENGSLMQLDEGSKENVVTGIIRAPGMDFKNEKTETLNHEINYAGMTFGTVASGHPENRTRLGVIGELIAHTINLGGSDRFGLLYVQLDTGHTACTCGCPDCTDADGCPCNGCGTACTCPNRTGGVTITPGSTTTVTHGAVFDILYFNVT